MTVTGTPQHNGLAERMNKMLLNKVRSQQQQWRRRHYGFKSGIGKLRDVEEYMVALALFTPYVEGLLLRVLVLQILGSVEGFEVELQGMHDRAKRTTTIPASYRDEGNVSLSRPSGSKVDDMAAYAFAIAEEEDTHEPITFQEAINSSEKDEWVRAMKEEMSSLKKNHTWELVDQLPGQKLISCKWLYKIKEGIGGVQKPRYKARVVARGVILSLTACEDYELEQLDVKMAFLHGNLEETIYMRQPPGFEEGTGNKVCLLKKSLYGLKQSPRQWYKRFDVYMISNGFSRNNYDSCVYFKEFALGMYIYLLLYVDDMLIACKSKSEIEYTKGLLRKEFDMKELGPARKILGMEIVRDRVGLCAIGSTLQGSLMYLMVCTRPDIAYVVSIVSKYLVNLGLVYGRDQGKHVDVDGFVDADYAKDPDKGRSITGYVFMVHGCVVSWKATLQHVVALSTTEAEYMALTKVVKESIWLKGLIIERDIMESKEIGVAKIDTKDNAADAFTKVVPGPKFKYCMKILGVGANKLLPCHLQDRPPELIGKLSDEKLHAGNKGTSEEELELKTEYGSEFTNKLEGMF
ncbi:retrotransposon protein, putative, ty1-copia subclass [Tanacetum coccineum]|uniref:Retrotransposon protein, putative, ty1-copia subclass n=1 Tax=Tanacetum coccineum TaxID=301880 RepID=A0ABQ5I3W1_9ASTR